MLLSGKELPGKMNKFTQRDKGQKVFTLIQFFIITINRIKKSNIEPFYDKNKLTYVK